MENDPQATNEKVESKIDSVDRDISELLEIADRFAKGARASNDQRWALKLALDTRLKLREWIQPKAIQKHDVTSGGNPLPIYGGLSNNNSDTKDILPHQED